MRAIHHPWGERAQLVRSKPRTKENPRLSKLLQHVQPPARSLQKFSFFPRPGILEQHTTGVELSLREINQNSGRNRLNPSFHNLKCCFKNSATTSFTSRCSTSTEKFICLI